MKSNGADSLRSRTKRFALSIVKMCQSPCIERMRQEFSETNYSGRHSDSRKLSRSMPSKAQSRVYR